MVANWIWTQNVMFKSQQKQKAIGAALKVVGMFGGLTGGGGTGNTPVNPAMGPVGISSIVAGKSTGEQFLTMLAAGGVPKGHATGTRNVPKTGLAMLHQGEEVIPKHKTGQAITIINLVEEKMITGIMAKNPKAIINIISADISKGGQTRKVIMGNT